MRQLDLFEDTPMAEYVVGSKEKAFNGYGQNGYAGPSSDTDLSNPTRSPMSRELFGDAKTAKCDQTRTVSDQPYRTHPGMKGAATGPKIAGHIHRTR